MTESVWRGWVCSSANEPPLQRALALLRERHKAEGRLIVVRGEAGAGASAFASRLHQMLAREGMRSELVPRMAMNADFVFMTHLLRSLGLPIYSADIHPPRRISLPYIAALHLRRYQTIIFDDGHDFFSKHQQKIHLTYKVLSYLLTPPFGYDVVFCGTYDGLTELGLRARGMGVEVVYVDLKAMECDEAYQHFVARTMEALALSKIPTYLVPFESPPAVFDPRQQGAIDAENDLIRMLVPKTIPLLFPEFVTSHGIDLYELHEHTKGLVGKTVSTLRALKASMVLDAKSMVGRAGALDKVPLPLAEVARVAEVAGAAEVLSIHSQVPAHSVKQQDSQPAEVLSIHAPKPKPKAVFERGFETYLKPVADETLGSWLSRNACSPSITIIHDDFLRWCTGLTQGSQQSYHSYKRQMLTRARGVADSNGLPIPARLAREVATAPSNEGNADQIPWDPAVLLGSAGYSVALGRDILEHDTLYRSQAFLNVFPARLQNRMHVQFSLPGDATHPRENRKYCAQCIADDVTAMRAPALRRAWRKRGAAVCIYHRHPVLLQRLDRSSLSELTGSWLAYSQHTQREAFDHGTGLISRSARGFQEIASECRICRIVGRLQVWVDNAPAKPTMSQPSKYALYFLLGFFLYQPTLISDGGIARWFIRLDKGSRLNAKLFDRPTVRQLVANIETAPPKAIAVAYLLIGCAFNLIRPAEHDFLQGALTFTDSVFPSDRGEIKALAQCFQNYHIVAVWESARRNLSAEDLAHVEWLLKK